MKYHHLLLSLVLSYSPGIRDISAQTAPASHREGNPDGFRGASAPIDDVRFIFKTEVPAHPLDVILGRPTSDSVTASILSYADREGYIDYGPQAGSLSAKTPPLQLKAGDPVQIKLGGLKPDTEYFYRLHTRIGTGEWVTEPQHSFRTQRAPGHEFTFTIQADSHLDYNTDPALYLLSLSNALAAHPDFQIDLGDTFMTDKHRFREDAAAQYLAQRYYFGETAHSAPLFLVLGNHDGEAGRWLDGSTNNMTLWANAERKRYFPNPEPDKFYSGNGTPSAGAGLLQDYYSWEWGDALFIVLDPFWFTSRSRGGDDCWSHTLGKAQYDWLSRTLESSKAKYRFVFLHHLVGGSGKDSRGGIEAAPFFEWGGKNPDGTSGFNYQRPGWSVPIHDLLVKNHVNIVFHGHDHLFVKQDLDGIVYQEVPQPGYPRYDNTRSASEYGYTHGDLLPSPGNLRVHVGADKAVVEYVRAVLPSNKTAGVTNGETSFSYEVHPR